MNYIGNIYEIGYMGMHQVRLELVRNHSRSESALWVFSQRSVANAAVRYKISKIILGYHKRYPSFLVVLILFD